MEGARESLGLDVTNLVQFSVVLGSKNPNKKLAFYW